MRVTALLAICLNFATAATAKDHFLPAGLPITCVMQENDFSLKTAEAGDPTICYLPPVMNFGRPLFPRGSYLTGRLAGGTPPGRLHGKGTLVIEFDRVVVSDEVRLPISVKVIAAPKYRVSPDGKILGKGHAKRDAAEWVMPPLWPVAAAELPRRGPWPAIKGKNNRLLLRVMEDALIPSWDDALSYYSPAVEPYHNPVRNGGDVVLVRKDGSAVSVIDYWYEVPGQAVNFLVKGGPGQRFGTIPLDDLDIKETTRINRERGIEFKVVR